MYARAPTDDNEGLWNELEGVEPPPRRFQSNVAGEFRRFVHLVWDAAYESYHQAMGATARLHASTTTETYLHDFGIPTQATTTTDPLVEDSDAQGFLLLPSFRRTQADHSTVGNLDLYFSGLYAYYYQRGLVPIVGHHVVELVSLVVTLALSVLLFCYVDWHALVQCRDEASCHDSFARYLRPHPWTQPSLLNISIMLLCLIFVAYALFRTWALGQAWLQAQQARHVFEDRLGISRRKLEGGAVDWDRDVVMKLQQLATAGDYRVSLQPIDALSVAHRILRKDNFLIALMNSLDILDLSVPWLERPVFGASLQWSIYFCVLNFMFNHKYEIRPAFYLDPASLRRRFVLCGIAHVIFMPFLLFFSTLHFGLQNAYDWKSTKQLGPREWTLAAQWTFREFSELPHHFERRMMPSYEAAEEYMSLFGSNEVVAALGRVMVFIGGSLGAVLFGFAAINDAILLHVRIADWNLLWYVGVVGVVYSAGKSMIPTSRAQPKSTRNLLAEIDAALAKVSLYTHYYPEIWKGKGWDTATYKQFSSMFKFKAQLFASELGAMILAPYVLCFSLARSAEAICDFILAARQEVPGVGDVCGYATFDFAKYGDEAWEGLAVTTERSPDVQPGALAESVMRLGSVDEAAKHFSTPKCRHGKMEKSFFNFKAAHPSWACPESGQNLVDRVDAYREHETTIYRQEQAMHIEAAARQLETLSRLERDAPDPSRAAPSLALSLHESYITHPQAHADAGAGSVNPPLPGSDRPHHAHLRTIGEETEHRFGSREEAVAEDPLLPFDEHPTNPPGGALAVLGSSRAHGRLSSSRAASNVALSTELMRLLNMSTLDADVSVSGLDSMNDDPNERQYMWLERYHSHMASQHREGEPRDDEPRAPPNEHS